jgi:hypothetical protein
MYIYRRKEYIDAKGWINKKKERILNLREMNLI